MPVLKVVHEGSESSATGAAVGSSLLDEIVRDGARRMLAAALQAEVAGYIEAHRHEVDEDGHRLVVRNGYHAEREVTTAAGPVPVKQLLNKELNEVIQNSLALLDEDKRLVFTLKVFQQCSYEEIAEITACNLGTVKSRLNRARTAFAAIIEPFVD